MKTLRNSLIPLVVLLLAVRSALADGNLVPRLLAEEAAVREAAMEELRRLGSDERQALVPKLTPVLSTTRQALAAEALVQIGDIAVPALEKLMDPADRGTHDQTIQMLGRIGSPKAVAILKGALEDEDDAVSFRLLIEAINIAGSVSEELLPVLVRALSFDEAVRSACTAIGELAPDAVEAVPALALCLLDGHAGRRRINYLDKTRIMETLSRFGPAAAEAIPPVVLVMGDDSIALRSQAATRLATMGPHARIAAIAALESSNVYRREEAAHALSLMEPYDDELETVLIRLLDDPNGRVSAYAHARLRDIHTPAVEQAQARKAKERELRAEPVGNAAKTDGDTLRTKEEIVAGSPSDANHQYPYELERGIPIGRGRNSHFVTVHSGQDWPTRVAIWQRTGQRHRLLWQDQRNMGHFEEIRHFHHDKNWYIHVPWIHDGTGHYRQDNLFQIRRPGQLEEVEIVYAPDALKDQLDSGEAVWKGESMDFTSAALGFKFYIWNKDDGNCCPSAGMVEGTYRIEGDAGRGEALQLVVDAWEHKEIPKER